MWLNPAVASSNAPNVSLTLANGTGLASISHLFCALRRDGADDTMRMDELKSAPVGQDVVRPGPARRPWILSP